MNRMHWGYGCLLIFVFGLCVGLVDAQLIAQRPQASGGNLVGVWQADKIPLQVYAPADVAAAFSAQFSGDITGTLTLNADSTFQADFITTSNASFTVFFQTFTISAADTNRHDGTYSVSGTQVILTPNSATVSADTVQFTATDDSLHFVQKVPLGEFESLAAGLLPPEDPLAAVIRFVRVGEPPPPANGGGSTLTADFNGNGVVDFSDFLVFASHFGKQSGEEGFDAAFDLNGNGAVDFADFLSFVSQFGKSTG